MEITLHKKTFKLMEEVQAKDLETHYNINLNYSLGNSHWRLLNHNQSWMQLFPHIQVKINSIVAKNSHFYIYLQL